jgi:hypothetical protein
MCGGEHLAPPGEMDAFDWTVGADSKARNPYDAGLRAVGPEHIREAPIRFELKHSILGSLLDRGHKQGLHARSVIHHAPALVTPTVRGAYYPVEVPAGLIHSRITVG